MSTQISTPIPFIEFISVSTETKLALPVVSENISAGFPSPAMDFIDLTIDLNKHFIKNRDATFFGRVKGKSMKDIGISDGDLLVIDKSIKPANDHIAVCYLDGEFTIKRIVIENSKCWLVPANKDYESLEVQEHNDFLVWGIVTYVIKSMRNVCSD
jgi:DNA polymerase V